MLADHPVNSVKPPDGDLDGSAVEEDDTHHVLVDEVYPISGLEDIHTLGRLFEFVLDSVLQILHHFFSRHISFLHFKYEVLVRRLIHPGDPLERLWEWCSKVELNGTLVVYHHPNCNGQTNQLN